MSDDKSSDNFDKDKSSADNVAEYLADDGAIEQRYYSQEQPFSADELSKVINEARLNELLAQSDAFLDSLGGEIGEFSEDDNNGQ